MQAPDDYFAEPDKMPRPYVEFELRPHERRREVLKEGAKDPEIETVYEDVAYAIVRAPGSRDSVEKVASEWIEALRQQASQKRCPQHWPRAYKEALDAFLAGEAIPLHGTPIKTWSALTPAQRKAILKADILTVEDLALANSDMQSRLGMGALALIDMAKAWIAEKNGPGQLAMKLEALTVRNQELTSQVEQLLAAVHSLQSQVPGATKASLTEEQHPVAKVAMTFGAD